MTETKYTEKELQEMADALLKEADAQQHEIEEEVIKSNKGQLDEKTIASLPAAQLIQNNERLKELFIKGKRHGKLESNELSEVLDALSLIHISRSPRRQPSAAAAAGPARSPARSIPEPTDHFR